ncbi:MAG: hypothetical protein ACE5FU_07425 [Nitrospinota bacterium]
MRYQKIHSQMWHDEKFITLSEDAQKLFLYCMTSPHSNMIGLYVLPKLYILADLKWSQERFAKPFSELLTKPLIEYDKSVNLILILNHFKHNLLENPNQVKKAIKIVEGLPASPLFSQLKQKVKQLDKGFVEPLCKQLGKRLGKPEEETEEEKEEEKEKNIKKEKFKIFEEKFWPDYPARNGKKVLKAKAREFFVKRIKDEEVSLTLQAVRNYASSKECRNGYAKDAIRFLQNDYWRDWIEPERPQERKGVKNANSKAGDGIFTGLNKKDYRKGAF